jgi:formylglycine-generating enzyme required for sulfatase activity
MPLAPLSPNELLHPDPTSEGGARFVLERPLSAGGFAITYLAWDQQFQDRCVIKELAIDELMARSGRTMVALPGREEDVAVWVQKVQKEAQVLNSLRSSGVVPIRATWRENGTAYFAMDFIDGIELPLEPTPGVGWDVWEPLARRFLAALGAIHDAGLVHGDIKPQNVLVKKDGTPVIIDFGTARSTNEAKKTRLTTIAMTPGYCPPELAVRDRAKEMGPWSDLYSWALTIMGLVIRHRGMDGSPLESTARIALAQHGLKEAGIGAETAAELRQAGLPESWVAALMDCVAVEPAARPQSVAALLARIDAPQQVASPFAASAAPTAASVPPPPANPPATATLQAAASAAQPAPIPTTESAPPAGNKGGGMKWAIAAAALFALAVAAFFFAGRPVCGNGKVEEGEGCNTCPQDVACGPMTECVANSCTNTCGNGHADPGETCSNCAAEVTCAASEFCDETTHACRLKCGNGTVEPEETCESCPIDAGCCEGTWMENGKCVGCPAGFKLVKAGEFMMGASPSDVRRRAVDEPYLEPLPAARRVRVASDFCFALGETSNGVYRTHVGTPPSLNQGKEYPVESVTFEQAMDFANARSKGERLTPCYNAGILEPTCNGFRLPSDAEWEYAARAGSDKPIYARPIDAIAWTFENSGLETHPRSVPSKALTRPNGWGFYDTLGNVAEFTTQTLVCPAGSDLVIAKTASNMQSHYQGNPSVRGGSYMQSETVARLDDHSAMIDGEEMEQVDRASWIGIRLVRNIPIPLPDNATLGCTGPDQLEP